MRPRPDRLSRLPEQYFGALLGRIAGSAAVEGAPVVDLGRGNPETGPPPHVIATLADTARTARARTATRRFAGSLSCAPPWADRYTSVYGVELDPEREVAVVPGTKTAIVELSMALAERGSSVLLPDPYYPDYPSGPALAGATLETVPLDPAEAWQPDFSRAPRENVAALYLNYPSNPCAVVVRDGTFERAIAYASETGAAVVHDFAYGDLVFDGRTPQSFLATPGAKDVGVEMFSMSKSYGMAGWRLGFVVGNAEIVERINLLNDHCRVGIFRPIQEAGIAALTGPQDSVAERVETYQRRRDRVLEVVDAVCEGTFYVWFKLAGGPHRGSAPDRAPARARTGRRLRPVRRRLGADLARGHGRDARGWTRTPLTRPGSLLDRDKLADRSLLRSAFEANDEAQVERPSQSLQGRDAGSVPAALDAGDGGMARVHPGSEFSLGQAQPHAVSDHQARNVLEWSKALLFDPIGRASGSAAPPTFSGERSDRDSRG